MEIIYCVLYTLVLGHSPCKNYDLFKCLFYYSNIMIIVEKVLHFREAANSKNTTIATVVLLCQLRDPLRYNCEQITIVNKLHAM